MNEESYFVRDFKLWLGLVALFISGVCVGAFGTWIIAEKHIMESVVHERFPAPQAVTRRLVRELNLDDAQRQHIESIVMHTHEELKALRDRVRPERRRIMEQSLQAMKAGLTPEQQRKLEEIHKRFEDRRTHKGRGGRRGEQD